VLVGSSSTQVFNICNDGDCEIKFKLSVTQKIEGSSAAQALSANGKMPGNARPSSNYTS